MDVFFTPEDRQRYLAWLADYAQRQGVDVLGWCLMTNHVHLVLRPPEEQPAALGLTLRGLHMRYSQWVNRRQGWSGHLWQSRFYSCVLDDRHCWAALRYVEQNPVRAGLVTEAPAYPWSSAAAHCGLADGPGLDERWFAGVTPAAWREELRVPLVDEELDLVRRRTFNGLPCGSADHMKAVGERLGRELQERGRGRPPGSAG